MIIDCHCHAGQGDLLTAPWNTDAPLDAYLRRARSSGHRPHRGFRRPFHTDYAEANEKLARIVAQHAAGLSALPSSMPAGTPAASSRWSNAR